MQTYLTSILLLITVITWVPNESAADELPADVKERFTQAANRTFKAFDSRQEQTWQAV